MAKRISRATAHAQTWYNCAVRVGFILQKSAHSHGVGIYSYTREECAPLQPLVSASTAPVNVINAVQSCRNQKQSQNDHCAKFGFLIVHWITSVFSLVAQSAGTGLSEISRLPFQGKAQISGRWGLCSALWCLVCHHGPGHEVTAGGLIQPRACGRRQLRIHRKQCLDLFLFAFNLLKLFYLLEAITTRKAHKTNKQTKPNKPRITGGWKKVHCTSSSWP